MKTAKRTESTDVECIRDARRAATLLHPLRLDILRHAGSPTSASEIADRLGLPRQRVNYHVRELAKAGFLVKSGTRRKRNLIERLYVASAGGYMVDPEMLGGVATDAIAAGSASGASHLLAVAARSQAEVARATRSASRSGQEVAAFTLNAELRFESSEQRARFAAALSKAVEGVVREHAGAAVGADGGAGPGRAHRLVVLCHPIAEPATG